MQRFLMWTAALTVAFAVGVAAQANLTMEEHAKLMKANGQAAQATNRALGSGAVADAKAGVATLRTNYTNLLAFYSAKQKDDAVARDVGTAQPPEGVLEQLTMWVHQAEGLAMNEELVDEMAENIEYASEWIPQWAAEAGLSVERLERNQLQICDEAREVRIRLECADVFDFIQRNKAPADLLIAHAFLDLLPMPESLLKLLSLTNGLAWLTINFDGVTTFEPTINAALDDQIERLAFVRHLLVDRINVFGASADFNIMNIMLRQQFDEVCFNRFDLFLTIGLLFVIELFSDLVILVGVVILKS